MRKVLVIDSRRYLHEDLRMQLIVNGTEEQYRITAYSPKDPETLKTYMNGKLFDLILIEHAELESRCDPSCFGEMKLYGYSVSRDAPVLFDAKGIPFMGCAPKAEDLLRIIGEIYDGKTPEPADNPAAAEPSSAPPVPESPPRPAPEASPLRGNMILQTQLKKAEQPYQAMDTAGPPEEKTRCIAVWSAKGGVGKSTIAANLALYLSMIPHGRGLYKVCLVDYNIESGDIRTILGIQGDHLSDMSLWADEIHLQLARGRRPEDITFSQTRIAEYLETSDAKTGLSVLLAPELHEKAQFAVLQILVSQEQSVFLPFPSAVKRYKRRIPVVRPAPATLPTLPGERCPYFAMHLATYGKHVLPSGFRTKFRRELVSDAVMFLVCRMHTKST